jgi:endonuclease III
MSASNRSALINKTYKILKKHYKPVKPPDDRSLLEHLLYACCLENSSHESADEAFAKLQQSYFDWNEVRVTTVAELAESLASLPDPAAAAGRLKRCLQSVFEAHYAFDIEVLRKQNLGKSVEQLEKTHGITPFGVAYVAQNGLGGHSIPMSQGAFDALEVIGLISEADARKHRVPGLERTIAKSKGVEFASLLHQLGADYFASPWGHKVRAILVEIEPEAKDRLPKRTVKTPPTADVPPVPSKTPPRKSGPTPPPPSAAAPTPAPAPPAAAGEAPKRKKESKAEPPAAENKPSAERAERKAAKDAGKEAAGERRSPTKQLTRRKPR